MRGSKVTKIPFHGMVTTALVSNVSQVNLTPSATAALADLETAFELYRFGSFAFRLHPAATMNGPQSAAWIPEATVPTTTVQNNFECIDSTWLATRTTQPSSWVHVPKERLLGQLKWYKCNADAGAAEFEVQGVVNIAGTTTDTFYLEVKGVCEFMNPIDSSVALRGRLKELKDKAKIEARAEVMSELQGQVMGIQVIKDSPVVIRKIDLSPGPPYPGKV